MILPFLSNPPQSSRLYWVEQGCIAPKRMDYLLNHDVIFGSRNPPFSTQGNTIEAVTRGKVDTITNPSTEGFFI
jgi:hypothetical protein